MRSFQKNATFCVLLHKNVAFFAFFYVLCKRTLRSLRSFRFFCVLKKRMQKNTSFFWVSKVTKNSKKEHKRTLRSLKERCVQKAKEFSAQPWVETRVLSEIATRGIVISVLCEIAIKGGGVETG